jgi:hypothetical protein
MRRRWTQVPAGRAVVPSIYNWRMSSGPAPDVPGHGRGLVKIRLQPAEMSWSDGQGTWMIHGTTSAYEIICPDCGDNGGPYDQQTTTVKTVRGPYSDANAATRAAEQHMGLARFRH